MAGLRRARRGQLRAGTTHSSLVLDGDTAVGWCQYGSPEELPRIKSRRAYEAGSPDRPDWRIPCFFTGAGHRRAGVAAVALAGALAQIARLGGGMVEAYPEYVEGRAVSSSFLHGGTVAMFEAQGFARVRAIGRHRWVVARVVEPAR